jgi:heme/copper-type cytochrome/quinol oxidase subunit 2
VVKFDRPWLVESPVIVIIFVILFIISFYTELISLAPKAFEFAESFSKPARSPLIGFQKWWALCYPLFKRDLFIGNLFAGFKTGKIAPCRFSKTLGATPRHLWSNRSKGFVLASFEKLSEDLKAFGTKRLGNYSFSLKLKIYMSLSPA